MRVYNTLGGQKQELQTVNPQEVHMYVCGPTTYNYIHLGNARPLVVFDTIRRYLEYRGQQVKYVQNFTDVDDKIIKRANQEGQDPVELAAGYIEEYFKDADALNIRRADIHPRVSQHIPQIIVAIGTLVEKGSAYPVDGDVYFRVRSFPGYGKLSGRSQEEMLSGARVEVDERKEDPADFALWKAAKPGEPSWDSPWGAGRPGWHIECSVMATHYLGDTVDIHGGGADLIFPHHENEIAQAEALTGKPFVKYWLHNGFITINQEKMSKSLGNFFLLRDILDKFPPDVVRFYLIATHYRSPLDFDDGKLEEARRALGRLKTALSLGGEFAAENRPGQEQLLPEATRLLARFTELQEDFCQAMDDDFNTARAIGAMFEMAHVLNSFTSSADHQDMGNKNAVAQAVETLRELGEVLGFFMDTSARNNDEWLTLVVLELLAQLRREARQEKDYPLADHIRDRLEAMQVQAEDTPEGTRFRYEALPPLQQVVEELLSQRAEAKAQRAFARADFIRDGLKERGIIVEDTREGARWKLADD